MAEPPSGARRLWAVIEHPRTNVALALVLTGIGIYSPHTVALILWGLALLLALRSAYEWEPIRSRIPIEVEVRRRRQIVKPLPVVVEGGWLDYELAMMAALSTIIQLLDRVTRETGKNTNRTVRHAQQVVAAKDAPVARRHRVATKAARDFERYASRLDRFEQDYREATHQASENYVNLVETAPTGTPWPVISDGLSRLVESTKSASSSTRAQRQSATDLRQARVSQALNQAMDHQVAALTKIIEDMDAFAFSCEQVISQIARRFPAERATS
ncbi:MAG TPA: hypothetical protein VNV65_05725 [Candidatus Solibacter sp.]|jgi:hypothetical protein|nr:hypothetical protein [Candidatus Solibacter sp.]